MQSFLIDANMKETESETEKTWVANVRDRVYDAEDIIDEFMYHVNSQQIQEGCSWILHTPFTFPKTLWVWHQTATKIQKINGIIKGAIPERKQRYESDPKEKFGVVHGGGEEMKDCKARRISIHKIDGELKSFNGMSKIRSFLVFNMTLKTLPSVSKMLRVLDLEDAPINELPDENDAEDYEFALFASKGFCFVWSSNSKYCLGILQLISLLNTHAFSSDSCEGVHSANSAITSTTASATIPAPESVISPTPESIPPTLPALDQLQIEVPSMSHPSHVSGSSPIPTAIADITPHLDNVSLTPSLRRSQRVFKPPTYLQSYKCSSVFCDQFSHSTSSIKSGSSPPTSGTKYPLSSYLFTSKLSPSYANFCSLITHIPEPKSYFEALKNPKW
ncbi:disease resistance protein rpm1 [Quercus suber]|uniref:Disease resistance protein rpm1 n=1 Tax=Quercus suber TaxID=58331 RepID=A0AAW0KE97_QUESU